MDSTIKKIVVVGSDFDAWLSAFALQVAFKNVISGFQVELVELPSRLSPQDVLVTLPSHKALLESLGINETQILKAARGSCSQAQCFSGWSDERGSFFHPYDSHGMKIEGVDFLQCWIKGKINGLDVDLENFSLGTAAAKKGACVIHSEKSAGFSQAVRGYHLSALNYTRAIGKAAIQSGVSHKRTGGIKKVHFNEEVISSITTDDGCEIVADLFIDASGDRRALIGECSKSIFQDWGDLFPCDKRITCDAPPLTPIPAYSRIAAFAEGWVGVYPLMNRTAISVSFSTRYISPEGALEKANTLLGVGVTNPVLIDSNYGVLEKPWIGNCVAVGDAAVMLDQIDAVHTSILNAGLSYLIELMPTGKDSVVESKFYNEKLRNQAFLTRDFQLAHYKLNQRCSDPFWVACQKVDAPESLQYKIDLFSESGRVAIAEGETFLEENWASILVGHGVVPKNYSGLVDNFPDRNLVLTFQEILKTINEEVEEFPSMSTYLEMLG